MRQHTIDKRPIPVLIATCLFVSGCAEENAPPSTSDSESSSRAAEGIDLPGSQAEAPDTTVPFNIDEADIAKVKVLADGTIFLAEEEVTIDELKTALAELKRKNGSVHYYRERAVSSPPRQAMAVLKAVSDAELPVKLYTNPEFADRLETTRIKGIGPSRRR